MKRITAPFILSLFCLFLSKAQAQAQEAKANWAFNAYVGANYDFRSFNITQSNGARLSSNGLQFGVSRQKKKFYQELVLVHMNKSSSMDLNPYHDSLGREVYDWNNYDDIRQFNYGFAYQAGWQLIGNETSKFKVIGGLDLAYNYSNLKINEVMENEYVWFTRSSIHSLRFGAFSKCSYSLTKAWSVNMTFLYQPFYVAYWNFKNYTPNSTDKKKDRSTFSGTGGFDLDGRIGVSYQF